MPAQQGWNINYDDGLRYGIGPFDLHTALSIAIQVAHTAGEAGHDTSVLMQEQGGNWHTKWKYGRDSYEPSIFGRSVAPKQDEPIDFERFSRKK